MESNEEFEDIQQVRRELPIFEFKNQIIDLIKHNLVRLNKGINS